MKILELLDTLSQSSSLNTQELEEFYTLFLTTTFIVPTNNQQFEIPSEVKADNPFNDIMAMQTADDVIYVPIFSSEEEQKEWYPNALDIRKITGKNLCTKLPEPWGISLNPASELGKEFSHWEVLRLRSGAPEDIKEIIAEHLSAESSVVNFEPINDKQREHFQKTIFSHLSAFTSIKNIYCGIHRIEQEGENVEIFLFGVLLKQSLTDDETAALDQLIRQSLIGNSDYSIHYGINFDDDPNLALFRLVEPLY